MANMTISPDGVTIVIQIQNHSYTLTASMDKISLSGMPPEVPKHLHFHYKDTYENAIDIGTMHQVMEEVQALLDVTGLPSDVKPFVDQWTEIQTKLRGAPILGEAIVTVENTNVRITEIELKLTKVNGKYTGRLGLGLIFTPDPAHRPKIFNIQVLAFGAVLHVELEGNVSDLKFNW